MARRTQTYAIRLAVEGGGQVKAELITVGQSGEQSLKRIETAGGRASGGLKALGHKAAAAHRHPHPRRRARGCGHVGWSRRAGGPLDLGRGCDRQDRRQDRGRRGGAALRRKASGVEQQTLDMARQRFTRRAAEAAQGTGEAKDALASMGVALRDQDGHLRRSEDLLADVADAFARMKDPAERMRLAFKLLPPPSSPAAPSRLPRFPPD
jgi:hypothetical protein